MTRIYTTLGPSGLGNYESDLASDSITFERVSKPAHGLLIPGFVDIHIHGAFGFDFMSASEDDMLKLCAALSDKGYEAFLPTSVSASAEEVLNAAGNMPDHPMIKGFHLEGPFLSPEFPGAQPRAAILDPPAVASQWDFVFNHPRLKVVTLAPELPNSLALTTRLMQRGVIVSMGHTNATYDEARRGFEFGASQATHSFNAMRPFHHREAGMVGYLLSNDALSAELIYDRVHVSLDAAKLLVRCKPAERLIAVSDATMAAGMPAGQRISMWGQPCITGDGDVRLYDGSLAGSAITLLEAFRNLAEDFGLELAIQACCLNPRRVLGMPEEPNVWLELDQSLEIVERHNLTLN